MRFLLTLLLLAPLAAFAQVITIAPDGSGDFTTDGVSDQIEINQALDLVAANPAPTTAYLKGPILTGLTTRYLFRQTPR